MFLHSYVVGPQARTQMESAVPVADTMTLREEWHSLMAWPLLMTSSLRMGEVRHITRVEIQCLSGTRSSLSVLKVLTSVHSQAHA